VAPPTWIGGSVSKPLMILTAALTVAALATMVFASVPAGLVLLVCAASVALTSSVSVTVGIDGVRVRAAPGWPTVTVPLDRIASADAIDVRPMRWGGWGYRGSLRLFRRAAWIVRAGPGLKLDLRDGKSFVVTVEDADEAAARVNGLLARE
jgi:hypothetical protein